MDNIELVVKIPDSFYETIKSDKYGVHQGRIYDIIRNGTPLPKAHSDLIDRNELLKEPMDLSNVPSNYVKIAKAIIKADTESKE